MYSFPSYSSIYCRHQRKNSTRTSITSTCTCTTTAPPPSPPVYNDINNNSYHYYSTENTKSTSPLLSSSPVYPNTSITTSTINATMNTITSSSNSSPSLSSFNSSSSSIYTMIEPFSPEDDITYCPLPISTLANDHGISSYHLSLLHSNTTMTTTTIPTMTTTNNLSNSNSNSNSPAIIPIIKSNNVTSIKIVDPSTREIIDLKQKAAYLSSSSSSSPLLSRPILH